MVPKQKQLATWFSYAEQLLNGGNTNMCIGEIENLFASEKRPYNEILDKSNRDIFELLALAYLRKGEQENCQNNHTPESCIIPMKKGAIHELTAGSEMAITLYAMLYDKFPNEKYKWLMNVAYMTLGKHPRKVPSQYLINMPNWNQEQKRFPKFEEIGMSVGIAENGLSGGASIEDFNNDGYLDLFMTSYGMEDNVRLYISDKNGGYLESTDSAGLKGIVSGLNCIHADFDNDGNVDILVLRGGWLGNPGSHPNSLLKNVGNGRFQDVTRSSGIYSKHPTQTAAWADVNQDGNLDLFIGNESKPGENHPCEFFMNNGDGSFTEKSEEIGLNKINGFVKGVAFGDINNDKWPDLYVSILGGKNELLKNVNGKFENISKSARVSNPKFSFPCWFWDVNNDGFQDIFVSGYDIRSQRDLGGEYGKELQDLEVKSDKPRLYINNGNETFTESATPYNISKTMYSMGSNFGDIDNDGYLDFYVGTGAPDFSTIVPNRMFRNIEGKTFEEVTSAGNFGHIQKGHGIAFADLDQDGDQDIYAVMGGAFEGDKFTNVLYENPISKNNWIVIELEGIKTNKKAIGTQIEIEFENGNKIFRSTGTGGSFGASSIQQEIGLGKNKSIKTLIIHWQNSESEIFNNVTSKQKIKIIEGQNQLTVIPYNKMPFNKTKEHIHVH
ncbi:MAG: CRTAC1 family protein [Crocinitomicaceae bacterium]